MKRIVWLTAFILCSGMSLSVQSQTGDDGSGLVVDQGYEAVHDHCGVCHSLRLVTQNRADRDGWAQMIQWMQETQGLWPLGKDEPVILDYLAKNYGPVKSGRRKPLPLLEHLQ